MIPNRRWCAAFAVSLMTSACATTNPLLRQECYNPDAQLASLMRPLEALRANGCVADDKHGPSTCEELGREVQRLAVVCPTHEPTLMAAAVIAYDEQRPADAQQALDQILAMPRSYPDAAVLRSQIAIEQGNVPFAMRLLDERIRLAPDHSGLREARAAALYLDGRFAESRNELAVAALLGAPRWRVAYHLGLIEEASGRRDEATRDYAEAVDANPGFAPAVSRLKALRAGSGVNP